MSQFVSIPLNYSSSMREYYHRLNHLPGFVLLESSDKLRGRYDILSAYPYETLRIEAQESNIEKTLQEIKQKLTIKKSIGDFPFQGGALGYISYDLGARLLGIKAQPQAHLKRMPLLDLGFYDWAIIADHFLQKTTLVAMHNEASTTEIISHILDFWRKNECEEEKFAVLKNSFVPLMSKQQYHDAFQVIQQELTRGRSYQVNFTQPFQASYEGDSWAFYKKISAENPVPFSAFLRMSDAEILSFSPERFLCHQVGHLSTSPIKGTIRRSENEIEDHNLIEALISCEKNKAENVMIVDLLRNDLGKISKPGTVEVSALCAVESYKAVHHLVSTIKSHSIQGLHPFDLFLSCFPGGSITGAPKIESMRIINELELHARGVYCGAVGYFSCHGDFDTNIAIRTITAKDGGLHLAAGGGIVIDSKLEEEYQECFIKIAAIVNGLQ